ncbi:MAG: Bro-N domain-containing protein [Bacteroidales bacterium]|nr:Bro-N domain-containing protein [Bacteroidales bacterium]
MMQKEKFELFEDRKVRTIWNDENEKWYFSIVDVIAVLTENDYQIARTYWKVLKHRLTKEGNQTVTNCNQLKLHAPDGKMRLTDVADTEQLFRLIQSIPSPKAEPFKVWMAQVAATRLLKPFLLSKRKGFTKRNDRSARALSGTPALSPPPRLRATSSVPHESRQRWAYARVKRTAIVFCP